MKTKIRPLFDRIVVLPDEPKKLTAGGLHVPNWEPADKVPLMHDAVTSVVVAVGPGRVKGGKLRPCELKIGERVIHERWIGADVIENGRTLKVMNEHEVMGVVK